MAPNPQASNGKSGAPQFRPIRQDIRFSREEVRPFDGASTYESENNVCRNIHLCRSAIEDELQGQYPIDLDRECIDTADFDEGYFLNEGRGWGREYRCGRCNSSRNGRRGRRSG